MAFIVAKNHYEEWKTSCVADEIIRENVVSLQGKAVDSKIFSGQRATEKFKDQYRGGGWWVTGLDPKDWEHRMNWGQLKLDNPRVKENGSILKYESPIGQPTRATFLSIPSKPNFWKNVAENTNIPIYITEGAKKAGCLLTLGFACVAIPGIWNTAKKDKNGKRHIIQELKPFLSKGRPVVYVYDADDQPRKKRNVYNAIKRTGRVFQDYGCNVSWVTWSSEDGKGIDDVCANLGKDAIAEILEKPYRLKTYEQELHHVGKFAIDTHVFEKFFDGEHGDWMSLDGVIHQWNPKLGFWEKSDEGMLKRAIGEFLSKCYIEKKAKDPDEEPIRHYKFGTFANLKACYRFAQSRLNRLQPKHSKNLRTFRNGTLDCASRIFRPWDKEDYLTWRVESDYKPNASLPGGIQSFLSSSFGDDLIPLIRAVTSMLIDPSAPWEHFPYLVGRSGGGKGTLISLWQAMFNEGSVTSSTDLSRLGKEEGRHQFLHGKALFTAPDVLGYVSGLDAFYELVRNGAMTGRTLFSSESYTRQFNVRFVVASVEPLQVEGSAGWDTRAIVIPLSTSAIPVRDPKLKQRLRGEVGDFISWALAMPQEERNGLLYYWRRSSNRLANAAYAMEIAADPMSAFVDGCLRPDLDGPGLNATQLQELYQAFAEATGKKGGMSISRVNSKLKAILPDFFEERRRYRKKEHNPQGLTMRPSMFKVKVSPGIFTQKMNLNAEVGWRVNKEKIDEGGLIAFDEALSELHGKALETISPQTKPMDETAIEMFDGPIAYPEETTESPQNSQERTTFEETQQSQTKPPTSQTPNAKPNSLPTHSLKEKDRVRDRRDISRVGEISDIDNDSSAPITVKWDDGGMGCYPLDEIEKIPAVNEAQLTTLT